MKRTLLAIVTFGLALNLVAQELPKTQVTDLNTGRQAAFNDIFEKGKVTLVSFWATWCIPGKREVRTIARNMAGWKKQADFNYIAVAVDQQDAGLARTFEQQQGWHFPVYTDPDNDLKRLLNFHPLPFIMIVDKKGKIVFTHTGYDDGTLILAKLKELAHAGTQ